MHTYNPAEQAASSPVGGYRCAIVADQAFADATGGTAAPIVGLSFPIKAGETWAFNLNLLTTGVSGGGKICISGPAAPTALSMTVKGLTSGITAFSTDTVTALDTLCAAYNTAAVTGNLEVKGIFAASVAGTVSFSCANVTNSNSFVVKAGSHLIATRLA